MQIAFKCRDAFATPTFEVNIFGGNRAEYFAANPRARYASTFSRRSPPSVLNGPKLIAMYPLLSLP